MNIPKIAESKIKKFIKSGHNKLHIVADFDRTLTYGANGVKGATTWGLIEQQLPPEYLNKQAVMYELYRRKEVNGTLTVKDARTWWTDSLRNFTSAKVPLADIFKNIHTLIRPRPGTKALFKTCSSLGIPIIILSAGIKNIIESWCLSYNLKPERILSTEILLDQNSCLIGWKPETLVHSLNKNEHNLLHNLAVIKSRPNTLLLGDSPDDASMSAGTQNVLRIMVKDPRSDHQKFTNSDNITDVENRFDMVLTDGNLDSVNMILGNFIPGTFIP